MDTFPFKTSARYFFYLDHTTFYSKIINPKAKWRSFLSLQIIEPN